MDEENARDADPFENTWCVLERNERSTKPCRGVLTVEANPSAAGNDTRGTEENARASDHGVALMEQPRIMDCTQLRQHL